MKHLVLATVFTFVGVTSGYAADVEIGSLSDGVLTWSNTLYNAVYQVEWASSLLSGDWTNTWAGQRNLASTNPTLQVSVPLFYRVSGISYPEETNSSECYNMYSNALLDAKDALPSEVSDRLLPITTNSLATEWRLFTNWVDSTTSRWVKVVTMQWSGGWTWNSLLLTGMVTMSNGWSAELWVTPYPQLYEVCTEYHGSNQRLCMQKALGLPPREGAYGVVEFFIDPKYLFRPAPDAEINDTSAGLAEDAASPYLHANPIRGVAQGFVDWFRDTYNSRGYNATNDLNSSWPWTRLGYTYDYANTPNRPVGLSEYVVPNASQTNYWGPELIIPIYVDTKTAAEDYGK